MVQRALILGIVVLVLLASTSVGQTDSLIEKKVLDEKTVTAINAAGAAGGETAKQLTAVKLIKENVKNATADEEAMKYPQPPPLPEDNEGISPEIREIMASKQDARLQNKVYDTMAIRRLAQKQKVEASNAFIAGDKIETAVVELSEKPKRSMEAAFIL